MSEGEERGRVKRGGQQKEKMERGKGGQTASDLLRRALSLSLWAILVPLPTLTLHCSICPARAQWPSPPGHLGASQAEGRSPSEPTAHLPPHLHSAHTSSLWRHQPSTGFQDSSNYREFLSSIQFLFLLFSFESAQRSAGVVQEDKS